MSVVNSTPLLAAAGGEYQISRSVRLRSSASAFLNRTLATPTNGIKWTWCGWVKRGAMASGTRYTLFSADVNSSNVCRVTFGSNYTSNSDTIEFTQTNGGSTTFRKETTAVYRDPSSYYYIHIVYDSANATAADRCQIWVNGVRVTSFSSSTDPALSTSSWINTAISHRIGQDGLSAASFDGYLTEVNFIDGQALTPSSFGETDVLTGVWKPKKYAGTYGTNGFYLNFSDNSNNTAATIGKDYSGNGNNWTPNNISVTAGATYDSMIDVPTPYADGGNGRGNYAVLNPLKTTKAPAEGNLAVLGASGSYVDSTYGTIGVTGSGKYYFEVTGCFIAGFNVSDINPSTNQTTGRVVYHGGIGYIYDEASAVQTGLATVNSTDVVGIALNLDAGTLAFYKNNTQLGTNVSISSSNTWWPFIQSINTYTSYVNFGQRPFAYTPPTGFKALNTQNLPEPVIAQGNKHFDVSTYNGTSANQTVTNSGGFQPDLVWTKVRNSADFHALTDSVRGASRWLTSNGTNAEFDYTAINSGVKSFVSNGFTLQADSSNIFNQTGRTYVGWQWKAAGSTVTNTAGSITSTVSANPTAGFSIVTYTGNGSTGTVGHGLGAAPSMIIVKKRTGTIGTATSSWPVYHKNLSLPSQSIVYLNLTNAQQSDVTLWNNTAPTSSVFSIGNTSLQNENTATYVAYCFSEVSGYSRFGSYTGNGSTDGPFVFCGFRPRFVMYKRTDSTANWLMLDTALNPSNNSSTYLLPNTSSSEGTDNVFDILSNGFKLRNGGATSNANGGTYIFMAFAESPFRNALAR